MYANKKKLNRKKQFLVGHEEELFTHYYVTMGNARSYQKLVNYCLVQGWVNPLEHEPPTRMALWFALWRWALKSENFARAYELYNKSLIDGGEFCSPDEWKSLLAERAQVCLAERDLEKWKRESGIAS